MGRGKHIDTRNLIVCETIDDFFNRIENLDSNVEDVVGYITSISRVLYWSNVESTWGVLGFTWDNISIIEDVPFNEEKLEHIEADGMNIDYSQKDAAWKIAHAVTQGYGHFNTTTIPFNIIPKLPDGYRITGFVNTFDNITSETIEVQKSDWSNFTTITNLVPLNKSLIIDLTGADITTSGGKLFQGNGTAVTNKSKLYIKADFSKLESISIRSGHQASHYKEDSPYLIVDEDNKYLNLPRVYNPQNSIVVLYYKGDGPLRIEYFFKEIYPTTFGYASGVNTFDNNYSPILYSENNKYEITVDENNNYYVIARRPADINTTFANEDEDAVEVTVNTTLNEDIKLSHYLSPNGQDIQNYRGTYNYKLNPVKYKGNVASIDWYNPFLYIYDKYPTFNADLFARLVDTEEGRFMPFTEFISLIKCPYTLDLSGRSYFNIFYFLRGKEYTTEYLDSLSNVELLKVVGNNRTYACDILPNLTGINKTFEVLNLPNDSLGASNSNNKVFWKCPAIKAKVFIGSGFYLDEETVIQVNKLHRRDTGTRKIASPVILLHDTEHVHIKITKNGGFYHIDRNQNYNYINVNSTFNYIEFKDVSYSIPSGMLFGKLSTTDREFFKQSIIEVRPEAVNVNITNYIQPYVMCNSTRNNSTEVRDINSYLWRNGVSSFNPSFIFIYRVNIWFSNNAVGSNSNIFTPAVIKDIVYHIEPLTDPEDYMQFIVKFDRSALNTISGTDVDTSTDRGAMLDYIENTAHYMVSIDENK